MRERWKCRRCGGTFTCDAYSDEPHSNAERQIEAHHAVSPECEAGITEWEEEER